jgi:hypothetical protein
MPNRFDMLPSAAVVCPFLVVVGQFGGTDELVAGLGVASELRQEVTAHRG